MKKCTACNSEKEDSEFYRRKKKDRYYLSTYCKACERDRSKTLKKKRYHDPSTRGHVLEINKARTSTDEYKAKINERNTTRYRTDSEFRAKILDDRKLMRADPVRNRKLQVRRSRYYQNNKSSIVSKQIQKVRERPRLKIRGYMRGRISEALARFGKSKGGISSLKYLPYTWDDLYRHLERHFEDWMNFSNYGPSIPDKRTWQVDHIIPQHYFPYDDMDSEMFRMCWDLKNLRPYDSLLNFKDGNRLAQFGSYSSILDIFEDVRKFSVQSHEDIRSVYYSLSRVEPVTDRCSMSLYGISYLDQIFPSRFDAKNARQLSFSEALKDDWKLFGAIIPLISRGRPITPMEIVRSLRFHVRTPGHFFPASAVSIMKRYSRGGRVFDPFLGWGGRALGAMCSGVEEYVGCDLQGSVVAGCEKLGFDLRSVGSTVRTRFYNEDCLGFLRSSSDQYDLIFTSPPFLDTEDYGVTSDSMRETWIDDFCFPFFEICKSRLLPGGSIALHLKDIKGSPTFSVYHSAAKAAGFIPVARHLYSRNWTQSIHIYQSTVV